MQLATDGAFLQAGLCNGMALADLLPGTLAALTDWGYIVARQHPGADGFFFADSPTCSAPSAANDIIDIESARTLNKAARLIRQALLPQLKGPLLLSPDGTLQPQVLNELEKRAGSTLEVQMSRNGELSAYDVYIDPEQVIASGSELKN